MKSIEKIIKENNRGQFYNYYKSIGYNEKTAATLALFTYGDNRYEKFSIDDCYDALIKGEDYLPPEIVEEREQYEHRGLGTRRGLALGRRKLCYAPTGGLNVEEMSEEPLPPLMKGSSFGGYGGVLREETFDEILCEAYSIKDGAVPMNVLGSMGFSTDEYESIEEKDARNTAIESTSTFRMTNNTASAGIVLNQLRNGRRIDQSMVRIEEMLNYFRYDSQIPKNEMFNVTYELMDVENDKKYLYVNVQGKEGVKDKQNIIILLDVSGSMSDETEETQAIIATIVSKLGNGDKISLITYSDEDITEIEAFTVNGEEDRIRVLEKLLSIEITGCTNGSKGINTAYKIGKKNYIEGGNNQVILITDGDLNFGITDKGGLEELIEKKKKDNLFLSVIGTGLYNYKDDKLETLSKHGNGVYRVVNNLADVKKSINNEYSSLVNVIAKDVKAQVEFNPEIVESYRLLGFENRMLNREDFTNDKVISETFGSGGYGVALYELKLRSDDTPVDNGLKYSKLTTTGSKELGTVKVRYKEPLEDVSHEIETVIESSEISYTDNLRLAFIVYVCAEKLRGSDKISSEEIDIAKSLYDVLGEDIKERNSSDLYKLAGVLYKSEKELGIGIEDDPFQW